MTFLFVIHFFFILNKKKVNIFKMLSPFCFILNKCLCFFNLKKLGQKWAQNGPKNAFFHCSVHYYFILKKNKRKKKIRKFLFHRFSGSKLPQKMVLAIFTRCLVPELCILCHFGVKSAILGPNSSRTKEITAKPMVLSYVGHFSKH